MVEAWQPGGFMRLWWDSLTEQEQREKNGFFALSPQQQLDRMQGARDWYQNEFVSKYATAEDYLDAVDRILSLGLRGAQEREISRIMVDCCLQEKVYNPFYRLVAKSLCAHSKQHRVSFRYALADQIKELGSSESPRRARHLMRLAGGLAADGEVPLLVLQALPWEEGVSKGMQAPLCSFVEAFFLDGSNEAVGGAFLRLSSSPGLETLRNGLALFLHGTFQKRILRAPERQQRLLLGRYKAALSGLNDDGGAW